MITLDVFKDAIDDMYVQLDPDRIGEWPVDGLEICIDGEMYEISLKVVNDPS